MSAWGLLGLTGRFPAARLNVRTRAPEQERRRPTCWRRRSSRDGSTRSESGVLVRHLALVNLAQTFRDIFATVKLLKDRGDAST